MLRRRPVMRTVARTAVVAGTASAVAGRVHRHQDQKFAEKDQAAYEEQMAAAPPPAPAPAAAPAVDPIERIKELAQLKDQGILTEEEFTAQKAKLLGT
jgi:putative oligomerization/nucleic acid binding protein